MSNLDYSKKKSKIPDGYFQKLLEKTHVNCIAELECDWKGELKDYIYHYNTHFLVKMCKQEKDTLDEDIPQLAECTYKIYGCCDLIKSHQMDKHMQESVSIHLNLLYTYFSSKLDQLGKGTLTFKCRNCVSPFCFVVTIVHKNVTFFELREDYQNFIKKK